MVRLASLHDSARENIETLDCPDLASSQQGIPFVPPIPRNLRKVALISSAGLIQHGDAPFRASDAGYRSFSSDISNADIRISHISVNFDRTAATKNIEAIFPRESLQEMAEAGEIGAAAATHYSFMGATDPRDMEEAARELSRQLKADGVNTLVLLPV